MDLRTMFEVQRKTDVMILEKVKEQEYVAIKKIVALLTEIGEFANEVRTFKFWSQDQETRKQRAMEELADCLHFLVSIGIEANVKAKLVEGAFEENRTELLDNWGRLESQYGDELTTFLLADAYRQTVNFLMAKTEKTAVWIDVYVTFMALAHTLGISEAELELEFNRKDEVNRARQTEGY